MSTTTAIAVMDTDVGAAVAAPNDARGDVRAIPEGELIILRIKPHPLFILLSALGPVATCVAAAVALRWISGRQVQILGGPVLDFPVLRNVSMIPVVIAALILCWQTLEWGARTYLLTDRRVVRVSGVLRQLVVEVPLPRVQQVMLHRSLRERVFGVGTPGISSASSGGLSYVFWNMVSRPVDRMHVLRDTIARYGGNGHGGLGVPGGGIGDSGGAGRAPSAASGEQERRNECGGDEGSGAIGAPGTKGDA